MGASVGTLSATVNGAFGSGEPGGATGATPAVAGVPVRREPCWKASHHRANTTGILYGSASSGVTPRRRRTRPLRHKTGDSPHAGIHVIVGRAATRRTHDCANRTYGTHTLFHRVPW